MTLSFSIVVPHLNRRRMLQEALASVRAQNWERVEIIVVDGGSTDGSVEELRGVSDIKLLTGPDRGVFDAFNKGIAAATGEIIAILNSDDLYPPGAFRAVAEGFAARTTADAVCGTAVLMEDARVIETYADPGDKTLSPRTVMIGSCVPNARFFRRAAIDRIGSFSLDYKFVADRDWLARWHEAGLVTVPLAETVYIYRRHAGSLTFDADRAHERRIRTELLALARRWSGQSDASAALRKMARLLEGRCIAWLALATFRQGQPAEFLQALFKDDNRWSPRPLACLARSALDWAAWPFHRKRPGLR